MQFYAFVGSVLEKIDPSLLKVGYYIPPSQGVLETKHPHPWNKIYYNMFYMRKIEAQKSYITYLA